MVLLLRYSHLDCKHNNITKPLVSKNVVNISTLLIIAHYNDLARLYYKYSCSVLLTPSLLTNIL